MLLPLLLHAVAQIPVPWQCSFEATEDLSDWVLNPGTAGANDQWTLGSNTRSAGDSALYISTDGGENAIAGAKQNVVMAYRKIHFPEHASGYKEYDISFDWKAEGNGILYVFFDYYSNLITGTTNILQYASANKANTIPTSILNNAKYVSGGSYNRSSTMSGMPNWVNVSIDAGAGTTYSVRLTANNAKKDYALLFVWVNKNMDEEKISMGACIDNIQIASATYEKPSNLQASAHCEDSSFLVTWMGSVNNYALEYRRANQTSWRRFSHSAVPPSFQFLLKGMLDGTYDFRVRGWRGQDTTAYTYLNSQTLICLQNRCINYVDLENADCRYGQYASMSIDPFEIQGRVNYGPYEAATFHAVCTDTKMFDPRTGDSLRMIPVGEVASVRLGTWVSPGSNKFTLPDGTVTQIGAYSITYDLIADSANALLLLKYAIVLDGAHDDESRSYFRLEVLDEDDQLLDGTCGVKEFYCPANQEDAAAEGWYIHKDNSKTIYWKDWTTMGLNLQELGIQHGDHLRVRVIARGCTQGGHYGYGYFTLNCASATIATDQCTDRPTATADAPDGFSYIWFKEENADLVNNGIATDSHGNKVIVSREPTLTIQAGDDATYVCRLIDLVERSCYFELKTRMAPRMPYPQYIARHQPVNCNNYTQIVDDARVYDFTSDGSMNITNERCEYSVFTVRSLVSGHTMETSNPNFLVQGLATGDTLEITQTSFLINASCDRTKVDTLVLPNILTPDSIANVEECRNIGYTFYNEKLYQSGVYTHEMKNRFGCDSIEILNLTIHPVSNSTVIDTISSRALPYLLEGWYKGNLVSYERGAENAYIASQNFTVKFSNTYGCDSTVNLNLTVVPQLEASIDGVPEYLCADDGALPLAFSIFHGDFDSLTVIFDDAAKANGLRDTVIYHNPYQPIQETMGNISRAYPSTIVPDKYKMYVEMHQHPVCAPNIRDTFVLDVRYASAVLKQKWNDLITVYSADYNGGYAFIGYQWYKDGKPLEGETNPYYYGNLEDGSEYYVLLTRDDGVQQFTCPLVADTNPGEGIAETVVSHLPSLFRAGQTMSLPLAAPATVTLYTANGVKVCAWDQLARGYSMTAPAETGTYLLHIRYEDGSGQVGKMVVVP